VTSAMTGGRGRLVGLSLTGCLGRMRQWVTDRLPNELWAKGGGEEFEPK
jgi:hypothetical protein